METFSIEVVHQACFLVHIPENSMSPFEFSSEKDAQEFIKLVKLEAACDALGIYLDGEPK